MLNDIRYGIRALLGNPAVTIGAVVTLALADLRRHLLALTAVTAC